MTHKGKRMFITGIPTSGKTYLAKKLAEEKGGIAVNLDEVRKRYVSHEVYGPWINFYLNLDEKDYLLNASDEEKWDNLVKQSEALWPIFKEEIEKYSEEERFVVFECVNLLPHIVKEYNFPGVVLAGGSLEETIEGNVNNPRWGDTLELQRLEAEYFYTVERPRYVGEGEEFGWEVMTGGENNEI